jgi:hypothetical protein
MFHNRPLLLGIFLCHAAIARAETRLQAAPGAIVDGEYTFGREARELGRRVLTARNPKHAHLAGLSPLESVLKASASVKGRFVTNDTYGSGGTEHMRISGLTIDGQRYADQATNPAAGEVADGIALDGQYCTIEGNRVKQFHGTAVVASALQLVRRNNIANSFTGIEVNSSDTQITDNIVHGCRDYGLHVIGNAGDTYSQGNHYFGHARAAYNENGLVFRSDGDVFADADYGYYGTGHQARIDSPFFQHCHVAAIYLNASATHFSDATVNAQLKVSEHPSGCFGVWFDAGADQSSFTGEIVHSNYTHPVQTAAGSAIGVRCAGDQCRFVAYLRDLDGRDDTIGVHVPSAIKGGYFEFDTTGYHGANERLLDIDDVNLKACTFIFRGENIDTTSPGKYIDVAAGWKAAGSGNSIKLINTTTGAEVELRNQAY